MQILEVAMTSKFCKQSNIYSEYECKSISWPWSKNKYTNPLEGLGSVNANNTKNANINPLEGQGSINANNTKTANVLEYEEAIKSKSTGL